MTWQDYLIDRLGKHLEDAPHAKEWILGLDTGADIDAEVLGLSLAIDVASQSLTPDLLAAVLKMLPPPTSQVGTAFLAAIEEHGACRFSSSHTTNGMQEDFYGRVMGLYEFYAYSYRDSQYLSWSEEDINDLRVALQEEQGMSLGTIRRFAGANNTNWISDLHEIETEIGSPGRFSEGAATTIADLLGLPEKRPIIVGSPPELILIVYPQALLFRAWKPTTLDGFWVGGFFLSSEESDGWGQTHSCSGLVSSKRPVSSMRERIHEGFDALTHDFRGWYIGPVEKIVPDRASLYSEGLARWERLPVSHPAR